VRERQQLASSGVALDDEAVPRQWLATGNVAQFECEAFERRKARRFDVKVPEIEPPAATLTAAMLADETIEPALQSAGQAEIRPVDGQHERIVEDRAIEPVRHDEVDAVGMAVRVGTIGPFVDPGEAVHARWFV
jgi:hypothetical protein